MTDRGQLPPVNVRIFYFGEPWDAPRLDPDGTSEPIVEGDRGVLQPILDLDDDQNPLVREGARHAECELLAAVGHTVGACNCTMPDAGRREMARRCVELVDEGRAVRGLGTWWTYVGAS